jgi:hypothetical protein
VEVVRYKDLGPQLWLATFDKITGLLLEHRVVIGNGNELIITKAFGIRNIRQVRVSGLTELPDNQWLVELDQVGKESVSIPA